MQESMILWTIAELVAASVAQADRTLCAMAGWQLDEIGDYMGIRLPIFGGDKPAIIGLFIEEMRGERV